MRGLVQSLTIGELCQNRSGLLALANDPHHFEWVSREHAIQISDRRLLLVLVPGRLPTKDGYAQRSYCSAFGQNIIIWHI
jgi:hypothetical protein